jgi:hypothetical protein
LEQRVQLQDGLSLVLSAIFANQNNQSLEQSGDVWENVLADQTRFCGIFQTSNEINDRSDLLFLPYSPNRIPGLDAAANTSANTRNPVWDSALRARTNADQSTSPACPVADP